MAGGRVTAAMRATAFFAAAMILGGAAAASVPGLPAVAPEGPALANAGHGVQVRVQSSGDADADAVLAAVADIDKGGLLSVKDHEDALRSALANMPKPFVREQRIGDEIRYRGDSLDDCLRYAVSSAPRRGSRSFVCLGNPYPAAAFYLGSYYNEVGQPDRALEVLDLGRLAGPDSPVVASERDAALMALHRWDDALAGANQALAVADLASGDRARLLRNRGYALTELKRLDEAEQAYRDSLALEPDNALAHNELDYIAKLKAGGPTAPPGVLFRPNAPKGK
ncbi:MAG TPA: tetratricopeptide repeat protein [Caulobacteraceae bacterium]|nr:tetratricopeptide repeat protein [Caulobacteraceae bacterium]